MKTLTHNLIAVFNFTIIIFSGAQTAFSVGEKVNFKENLGQVYDQNYNTRPDVLFSGRTDNLIFHLKNKGISYQLNKVDGWKEEKDSRSNRIKKVVDQRSFYRVDIDWLNANPQVEIIKGETLTGFDNYYLSSCKDGVTGVKSYGSITYKNIYKGIDVTWYEKEGHLKYDYAIAAGADYKQIQLKIQGATKISLSTIGELIIETPLGKITEQAPLVKQKGKQLISGWQVKEEVVSFYIENFDPLLPLIIDPVVREWGTFYGEDSDGSGCTTTKKGEVYMAGGIAEVAVNIATSGAHQTTMGGYTDAWLAKFDSLGTRIWSTYYGGDNYDGGISCVTDTSDNVYLAGTTASYNGVIATPGAHQTGRTSPTAQGDDLFLVKFTSSGTRMWATYYGGDYNEDGGYCATDESGNVFLSGQTLSGNSSAIATAGSHQQNYGGNSLYDGFVAKFNSAGVRQWGTYYGGMGSESISSCLVDNLGNVFISGTTNSDGNSVIATQGSHQPVFNSSGLYDIYLVKFNSSGVRQWGTYYGGAGDDACSSACIDNSGNIFLTGTARSAIGITTPGAFQTNYMGPSSYLAKFTNAGILQWGTYYTRPSDGSFCTTNNAGDVFFGGSTSSTTDIATNGCYQPTYGGGTTDIFITKFSSSGVHQWGSYYGGNNFDDAGDCAVDNAGNIFISGTTASSDNISIASPGSYQDSCIQDSAYVGGSPSAFLVKLKDTDYHFDGIDEVKSNLSGLELFPNPAQNVITIGAKENNYKSGLNNIVIINNTGQVFKTQHFHSNDPLSIGVADLPEGLYIMNYMQDGTVSVSKRFIIAR